MAQTQTVSAPVDVNAILDALETWIKQRPGLDPANYGMHPEQWAYSSPEQRRAALRAYRSEIRSVGQDRQRALKALRLARQPYTWLNQPDLLMEAFQRAFSGRLSWVPGPGEPGCRCGVIRHEAGDNCAGGHLEYCTGQYWPTEYRKAAAAVLDHYTTACYDRDTAKKPAKTYTYSTISDVKEANREAGNHWFDPSAMRFFNTRIETPLISGQYFITSERMESDMPKKYTVRQAMPDGSVDTVGEFSTLGDARIAVRCLKS